MADTHDYDILRGDCLPISIVYKDADGAPIDLTGKGAIIAFACPTVGATAEFEINDTDLNGVTIDALNGAISGTVPHDTTKLAAVGKKKSIYQVILTDSPGGTGCRTTLLSGFVNITESAAELNED